MTAGLTGTAQGAVGLALGHDPALAVSAMSRIAARAEAAAFHTVFFSETMGSNRDSVTAHVAALSGSGASEEVTARLVAYREAGVDLPLLRPASAAQTEELLRLFGKSSTLPAGPAR
jgi:5,10-methylenetetrahydromethanopterin reductase